MSWFLTNQHISLRRQGIETVRRDNCLLVKNVVTTSLEKMLIEKDVDGAVSYVKVPAKHCSRMNGQLRSAPVLIPASAAFSRTPSKP